MNGAIKLSGTDNIILNGNWLSGDGGDEGVFVSTAGNVGIGTVSPGSKLAVSGNMVIGSGYATLAGPTDGLAIQGNVGIGTTGPSQKLDVAGSINLTGGIAGGTTYSGSGNITSSAGVLTISGTGNSSIAGNVGIGTTAPDHILHVSGSGGSEFVEVQSTGTDSNPHIKITNDANSWFLQTVGARSDAFEITQGTGTEFHINTNGNVGIGTTGPLAMLSVGASSQFQVNSTGDITTSSTGELTIGGTGNSSIAGNVGIGTTGPGANLEVVASSAPKIQLRTAGTGTYLYGQRSEGTIDAPSTITAAGRNLLILWGQGYGATAWKDAGWIAYQADGAFSDTSSPGRILFGTTPSGSTSVSERMRIDNAGLVTIAQNLVVSGTGNSSIAGNVGIGTTNPQRKLEVNGSIRMGALITGAGTAVAVYRDVNGDLADSTSSIRYKDSITDYEDVLPKLQGLRAVRFKWNNQTSTPGIADFGMIAEEVNQILPELVTYDADGVTPRGLKYEKMGLFALKGIQELSLIIDTQKGEIDNLKIVAAVDTPSKLDEINSMLNGVKKESSESAALVAELNSRVSFLEQLFSKDSSGSAVLGTATASASIARQITDQEIIFDKKLIAEGDMTVLGSTNVNDLSVTGRITTGLLVVNGYDDSLATPSATISTLSEPLRLQHLASAPVQIMGGRVNIDEKGNILVSEGDLTLTKGKIKAPEVQTDKLTITTPSIASESAVLTASIGKAVIPAGQTTIEVSTSALTSDSQIFLSSDLPISMGRKQTSADTFEIFLKEKLEVDLEISWWIVN